MENIANTDADSMSTPVVESNTIKRSLFRKLYDYIVLPSEISKAEVAHVHKMNRLSLFVAFFHVPFFVLVAWVCGTGILDALMYSAIILVGPATAHYLKLFNNPRTLSCVYGFASMCLGALLVHLGQGPFQIEMHFQFFVFLALLAVYGNPLAILVAAVTVAVHHALFWLFLPSSVFNYDASWWVVAIHALFVVLESVASIFIARNFHDNVIGLEKIISQRTRELDDRNASMKLILDNAGQGFLTLDSEGRIQGDRSAVITKWLGQISTGTLVWEYFGKHSQATSDSLRMGWDAIRDDIMPLTVILMQMPKSFTVGDTSYGFEYRPIYINNKLEKLLIVLSDITADVDRERFERQQREILGIFESLTNDKAGFIDFYDGATDLINHICTLTADKMSDAEINRHLHTLKGNCGVYGVTSVFDLVHEIETRIQDGEGNRISSSDQVLLSNHWSDIKDRLDPMVGDREATLDVVDSEISDAIDALNSGKSTDSIIHMVNSWRFEPMRRRLSRIGDQAISISKRLNKGNLELVVEDNQIRLNKHSWSNFWGAVIHAVRNAIDHGIESETEANGKKPMLHLRTYLTDTNFVFEIQDNGRGLDFQALKAVADQSSLPSESESDLIAAMFTDGISSRNEASIYSGRGVGLSALKHECEELGGRVRVATEAGKGTTFSFVFPLSAVTLDAKNDSGSLHQIAS